MSMAIQSVPAESPASIIPIVSIRAIIPMCIEDQDVPEATRRKYTRNMGLYCDWLKSEGRDGTAKADVLAYKEHLKECYAPSTVSAYLTAVRILYSWASSEGYVRNAAAGVKGMRQPHAYLKDPLTAQQARRLLRIGTGSEEPPTLQQLRDRALRSLILHTAIRQIEAQRADVRDLAVRTVLDSETGREIERNVLLVQRKGHDTKDDFVVLTPDCLADIEAYLKRRGAVDPWAPLFASLANRNIGERMTTHSIWRICSEGLHEIGAASPRVTPHSYRHFGVNAGLGPENDIMGAQSMAGHASIDTTMRYARNVRRLTDPAELRVADVLNR